MGSLVAVLARRRPPSPDAVRRALAAAPHRGAERGILVLGACALGVSATDALPDSSLAGAPDLAVAFTGRLDNLEDLAPGQAAAGRAHGSRRRGTAWWPASSGPTGSGPSNGSVARSRSR